MDVTCATYGRKQKFIVREPDGMRPLERFKHRWINIKINF
jgi:hypothetical protein